MNKEEFISFIEDIYEAEDLDQDLAIKVITKNFKDFEPSEFSDYYIFNKKYMEYIVGFGNYNRAMIFYTDHLCIEGYSIFLLDDFTCIGNYKCDLLKKRQEEFEAISKFIREEIEKRNEIEDNQIYN